MKAFMKQSVHKIVSVWTELEIIRLKLFLNTKLLKLYHVRIFLIIIKNDNMTNLPLFNLTATCNRNRMKNNRTLQQKNQAKSTSVVGLNSEKVPVPSTRNLNPSIRQLEQITHPSHYGVFFKKSFLLFIGWNPCFHFEKDIH